MHMGQALDLVSRYDSLRNPLTSLGDYLDPELISRCLAESGTVTAGNRDWCCKSSCFFLVFCNTGRSAGVIFEENVITRRRAGSQLPGRHRESGTTPGYQNHTENGIRDSQSQRR